MLHNNTQRARADNEALGGGGGGPAPGIEPGVGTNPISETRD